MKKKSLLHSQGAYWVHQPLPEVKSDLWAPKAKRKQSGYYRNWSWWEFELCRQLGAVLIQNTSMRMPKGLISFADSCINFLGKGVIAGYNTHEELAVIHCIQQWAGGETLLMCHQDTDFGKQCFENFLLKCLGLSVKKVQVKEWSSNLLLSCTRTS